MTSRESSGESARRKRHDVRIAVRSPLSLVVFTRSPMGTRRHRAEPGWCGTRRKAAGLVVEVVPPSNRGLGLLVSLEAI